MASDRKAAAKDDEEVGDDDLEVDAIVVKGANGETKPNGGTVAVVLHPPLPPLPPLIGLEIKPPPPGTPPATPTPTLLLMLLLLLLLRLQLLLFTPGGAVPETGGSR